MAEPPAAASSAQLAAGDDLVEACRPAAALARRGLLTAAGVAAGIPAPTALLAIRHLPPRSASPQVLAALFAAASSTPTIRILRTGYDRLSVQLFGST